MYADLTIKARCAEPAEVESILLDLHADYQGLDVQTDTYYEAEYGRLKHRKGNIENRLIHYSRQKQDDVRKTEVHLYLKNPSELTVKQICEGKKVIGQVKKLRKIFFIDNVKFHLDQVEGLGNFIEIEAIDLDGSIGTAYLWQQTQNYKDLLQICDEDIVQASYIDLLNYTEQHRY